MCVTLLCVCVFVQAFEDEEEDVDASRCANGRNFLNRNVLSSQLAPGNYTLYIYEPRPQVSERSAAAGRCADAVGCLIDCFFSSACCCRRFVAALWRQLRRV